jgi:voltage-gated potassium channel
VSKKPSKYIFSTWGIIDFLSVAPQFLSLLFNGANFLMILRLSRMLRVFRILKLTRFIKESEMLYNSLKLSVYKISIFMVFVLVLVIILGTIMYVIEGEDSGFTSIPQSIYWAIITITTVGYGDIVPATVLGKIIASAMMLIGYSILAVPTGIITLELSKNKAFDKKNCLNCLSENQNDSNFCHKCGHKFSV